MVTKLILTAICILFFLLAIHLVWGKDCSPISWKFGATELGVIIAVVTLLLMLRQIDQAIQIANEDRALQRSTHVQNEIALLRAFETEISNNQNISEKLMAGESEFSSGKTTNFITYSLDTLKSNLEQNTFKFNPDILQRSLNIYDFFRLSNNVFNAARSSGIKAEARKKLYSQSIREHHVNSQAIALFLQDLRKYINDYEEIAETIYVTTTREGTRILPMVNGNQLMISNSGGETAYEINLEVDFNGFTNSRLEFHDGQLASKMTMNFTLPHPAIVTGEATGSGVLSYSSRHSKGSKKEIFQIRYIHENDKWRLVKTSSPDLIIDEVGNVSLAVEKTPN